jgi:hypothetical protein
MKRPSWISRVTRKVREIGRTPDQIRDLKDLILFSQTKELQLHHPNPLNRFGKKCFSQSDEDGITLEILRRIGAQESGVFAEFGVGNGTENNTLILAALGWKGFWVGGEQLGFKVGSSAARRFSYLRAWITLDNIAELTQRGLQAVGASALDVISLDLDGNDIYFVEKLLATGHRPKLFIVEYNGKFPPPVRFQIAYDPHHIWAGDDYFGASLASFNALFERFSYRLLCCNSQTGANAFFVDGAHSAEFVDVPTDLGQVYVEPRYHFQNRFGHRQSLRTISSVINGTANVPKVD